MSKWFGTIGYATQEQTTPGDWADIIVERQYAGELTRLSSRWQSNTNSTNDDLNISNQITIVADPFAYDNFHNMKYVEFMGAKWKITSVDASLRPKLILTLGGVYNERET